MGTSQAVAWERDKPPAHGPLQLQLTQVKLAWILGSCSWPKGRKPGFWVQSEAEAVRGNQASRGTVRSNQAGRQKWLGAMRQAGEQLGASGPRLREVVGYLPRGPRLEGVQAS